MLLCRGMMYTGECGVKPDPEIKCFLRYECIHHDVMAEAAAHNKEMKNFMGAEISVFGIENRQFQRIDNAACGIDQSAGQEPAEGGPGQSQHNLTKHQKANPPHGNINE